MAILPAANQPISMSQIQNFVNTRYGTNSTSLRTMSNAAGLATPDNMSDFAAIPVTIWARNRFALTNPSHEITIVWKISASAGTGTYNTLSTQIIGTSYVNMGTFYVDPNEVTSSTRLRIGCQHPQPLGGIVNVQFGEGLNATNWTFQCGTFAPYTLSSMVTTTALYFNINVSSGQYAVC
jgi:hypothetical protein